MWITPCPTLKFMDIRPMKSMSEKCTPCPCLAGRISVDTRIHGYYCHPYGSERRRAVRIQDYAHGHEAAGSGEETTLGMSCFGTASSLAWCDADNRKNSCRQWQVHSWTLVVNQVVSLSLFTLDVNKIMKLQR